jgi:hypothetical protein
MNIITEAASKIAHNDDYIRSDIAKRYETTLSSSDDVRHDHIPDTMQVDL